MPLAAEGNLIDPPVSVPSDPKQSPAAVAEPEPLDDAPGHNSAFHGFFGGSIFGVVIGVGAFGLLQLAEDDRARILQARDDGGILGRTVVAMDGHAVRGRCALDPAKILDRNRHAVQRPLDLAGRDFLFGNGRFRKCGTRP